MSEVQSKNIFAVIRLPLLCLLAVVMVLAMMRLGVWQLGRAEQKAKILAQVQTRAAQTPVAIDSLIEQFTKPGGADLRFQPVSVSGNYLADKSIFVDNQVVEGKVGYQVFTPVQIGGGPWHVLVGRGWLPAGLSRAALPTFTTPQNSVELLGRLNLPPAQPPLWDDQYPVAKGAVWQYLPIQKFAAQMQLKLLPLVVELAPGQATDSQFVIAWSNIDDKWVAKHQAYAFQWFAMAVAFCIACLVLVLRTQAVKKKLTDS